MQLNGDNIDLSSKADNLFWDLCRSTAEARKISDHTQKEKSALFLTLMWGISWVFGYFLRTCKRNPLIAHDLQPEDVNLPVSISSQAGILTIPSYSDVAVIDIRVHSFIAIKKSSFQNPIVVEVCFKNLNGGDGFIITDQNGDLAPLQANWIKKSNYVGSQRGLRIRLGKRQIVGCCRET